MSLLDFWELYRDQGIIYAVIALLVFAVICLITPICKDKILYKIRHKRNIGYFLYGIIYAIVTLVLFKFDLVTFRSMMALIILDVLYLTICAYTVNYELPYAHYMLKKHERFLDEGLAAEHIDYFKSKHWYISETTEKIAFARLKGRYYDDMELSKEALDTFSEIDEKMLYEKEKIDFSVMRAMMLWKLGDYSATAKMIDNSDYDSHPVKHMLLSFISEYAGNYDEAYEKMKVAKDLCDIYKIDLVYHIQVLENYGRIQLIRGNQLEAEQYMLQANKILEEKLKNPRADLQKTVKQNLIHIEAVVHGDTPYVRSLLENYKNQIPANSVENSIAYNNCCVEFYRQINDTKEVYECIKNGYFELIGKLDINQKCVFQSSTFQMLMNGEFIHEWLDKEISNTYTNYVNLSLIDKIVVYKNFYGILCQPKYRILRKKAPYSNLWTQINEYYANSAIKEIDDFLLSLGPHEIYRRCQFIQEKLVILKYLERGNHIAKSKQMYIDLYNMYREMGSQIDAVNVLMILIDECEAPSNLEVQFSPFMLPVNYQEHLDKMPDGPKPSLLKDGYHLIYANYSPVIFRRYLKQKQLMQEQLEFIIPIVKSWKNHPAKYEFSLHIARFLIALERKDEAREFIDIFESSGLSIEHYAEWFKDDYYFIKAELSTENTANAQL